MIIRDDGSTDGTLKILAELSETYKEKIIFYSGNNIGTIKSFEWLLSKSNADYIMLSDHDDVWMDNKIEDTLLKMSDMEVKCPEKPLLVFTDLKVVDEDLDLVNESFWKYSRLDVKLASDFNYLGVCNCINACTIMINKNAKEIFGDIDASVCPVKYIYGKDGKPFYMNGPYESPADVQKIINTLTEKCGVNGFNTL